MSSSVPTVLEKLIFILLLRLPAPFLFLFAALSFPPSCLAPPSLTVTHLLPPRVPPPRPLGLLQFALHMVQVLRCHCDTVQLLQQGVQGGEEPLQRGLGFRLLPPAGAAHHHAGAEPQTQAQPKSQADPRRFC